MIFEGELKGEGLKIGIVAARFNEVITKQLLEGALNVLCRAGVKAEHCDVAWVPGSSEIPVVLKKMAPQYDAMIAIGCVIRGETVHYELVCQEFARGISQISIETGIPIISGVVMAENTTQAFERAGGKHGHKGEQAALSAIEMAHLVKKLGRGQFQSQWEQFRQKMDIPA